MTPRAPSATALMLDVLGQQQQQEQKLRRDSLSLSHTNTSLRGRRSSEAESTLPHTTADPTPPLLPPCRLLLSRTSNASMRLSRNRRASASQVLEEEDVQMNFSAAASLAPDEVARSSASCHLFRLPKVVDTDTL